MAGQLHVQDLALHLPGEKELFQEKKSPFVGNPLSKLTHGLPGLLRVGQGAGVALGWNGEGKGRIMEE